MLGANIPLYKLNNPALRQFLEKYTKETVPDESTLRKNYVEKVYVEKLNKLRDQLKESKIWISTDETTDAFGRYVANVIVGDLSQDGPSQPNLLYTTFLKKTNNVTITQTLTDAFGLL